MIDFSHPDIKTAIDSVTEAARLARHLQTELRHGPATSGQRLDKADRSPVTVADFAVQAVIARSLSRAFPQDPLVAEESIHLLQGETGLSTPTLTQVRDIVARLHPEAREADIVDWIGRGIGPVAPRFWVLDPIDGTKGFLRGDQFAIALALMVDGQVELGVLGCPVLSLGDNTDGGSLVVARRGHGTWACPLEHPGAFKRLHVSAVSGAKTARILHSVESAHINFAALDQFKKSLDTEAQSIAMDSQAKYATLAAGQADCLIRLASRERPRRDESIWDHAAGTLIVEEAGGTVTDLDGKPLDWRAGITLSHNRGTLASNGLLHNQALRAIGQMS